MAPVSITDLEGTFLKISGEVESVRTFTERKNLAVSFEDALIPRRDLLLKYITVDFSKRTSKWRYERYSFTAATLPNLRHDRSPIASGEDILGKRRIWQRRVMGRAQSEHSKRFQTKVHNQRIEMNFSRCMTNLF